MNKNRFFGKNVLITGGSSGIGLQVAKEFGKLGANIFLVARNRDRLQAAKEEISKSIGRNSNIYTFSADVAKREQIERVIHNVGEEHGGIHTLINNAGVTLCGLLQDNPIEEIEHILKTNYLGTLYALKAAWAYIKESRNGHIGFVSSVAGFTGLFGYTAYSPTKFAVTGLAECIRMESKEFGIGVTVIFPPDTDTPMLQYENEHSLAESKALSKNVRVMTPESVAKKFLAGILNYRFEVMCNFESRVIRFTKAFWPQLYYKTVDGIIANDRRRRNREDRQAEIK